MRIRIPSISPQLARDGVAVAVLVGASVAFRLPVLLNAAGDTNSDMAVVGLQAMHMLHGHFSWLLPGSGYQTSVDSAVAALWFAIFGAGPVTLILSALVNHILATLLAFATLRRHVQRALAVALALLLVLTPPVVHMYALHPPRQAALTVVFLAIWLLDGRRLALGGVTALLAVFADPYALVFVPSLLVLGTLIARERGAPAGERRRRAVRLWGGALAGAVPFAVLHASSRASSGQLGFDVHRLRHNLDLLLHKCLPWATSATAYYTPGWSEYQRWPAGPAVSAVQILGALVLVGGALSGLALVGARSVPAGVRRLGFAASIAVVVTLAGFLGSVMVMDLFSARYLAALVLMAPFAMAPLAVALASRRFFALIAPYLASAGMCGWLGYYPLAVGARITRIGAGDDERAVESLLAARGVHAATGDYWAAYRLTFLSGERLVVVPNHTHEDRFAAYRQQFNRATRVAYIYDRFRSREGFPRLLRSMAGSVRIDHGIYTVFIQDRQGAPGRGPQQADAPKKPADTDG